MDEVGRGTTVSDGLAIAFATVHHLYFNCGCRTLFATHFHEIADMLGYSDESPSPSTATPVFPKIGFFSTDVDETDVSCVNMLFSVPFIGLHHATLP